MRRSKRVEAINAGVYSQEEVDAQVKAFPWLKNNIDKKYLPKAERAEKPTPAKKSKK
jgi:hypothetical protein